MEKLGKLDLVGVLSVGVVAAGLLGGWVADTAHTAASHERHLARQALSVTADGRTKLTVTAKAPAVSPSRQVNTAASRHASGVSVSPLAPLLLRP